MFGLSDQVSSFKEVLTCLVQSVRLACVTAIVFALGGLPNGEAILRWFRRYTESRSVLGRTTSSGCASLLCVDEACVVCDEYPCTCITTCKDTAGFADPSLWKASGCAGRPPSSAASTTSAPDSPAGETSGSEPSLRSPRSFDTTGFEEAWSPEPQPQLELDMSEASDEADALATSADDSLARICGQHGTADNLRVARCFADLAGLPIGNLEALDLVMRALQLLRSCGFATHEICEVMAHASIYYKDVSRTFGQVQPSELGYILMLLMFIAHSYVDDEHCPLRIWHKHLFVNYCDMKTLNMAVMLLLKARDHNLSVEHEEVLRRHELFMQASAASGRGAQKRCGDSSSCSSGSAWLSSPMAPLQQDAACLA